MHAELCELNSPLFFLKFSDSGILELIFGYFLEPFRLVMSLSSNESISTLA